MTTYFEVLARMFVLHMSFAQYLLLTHIVVMLVLLLVKLIFVPSTATSLVKTWVLNKPRRIK